jgi:hypothetical protein
MLTRPGCLAPITLVLVVGALLVAGGLAADSMKTVRAGVAFLIAGAVLLVVGWWLRRSGWWD